MDDNQKGNWGWLALINAALAAWLIYDMTTEIEAPRQALLVMQWVFLAGALIAFAGALVKLVAGK